MQYGDGLVGPMLIHGPSTANYDIDLGVMPFTDWFHTPIFTVNAANYHAAGPPTADNVLINGSMTSAAGGQYAETTLTPGKLHLLRLVNTGINNYIHVGLDGHKFNVVAADFTPIVPYETDSLLIAVGKSTRSHLHNLALVRPTHEYASTLIDVSLTMRSFIRSTIRCHYQCNPRSC